MGAPKEEVVVEEDLLYEEELLRSPYSLKVWLRYLEHKKDASPKARNLLYERAVSHLPGSYKLWSRYLKERRDQVAERAVSDNAFDAANNAHERALVFMHKMPRIWQDFTEFLMIQKKVTSVRRTLDRALRALPITQHERVWVVYIKFVRQPFIPVDTAMRVYRRYLKLEPDEVEEYYNYLISADHLDEAAQNFATALNRDNFVSASNKTSHQMWVELCELIAKNPDKVKSLKVDPIIRQGISKFENEVGRLWCSLADYYIRAAQFEKARDIYEEGISTTRTVRDFSMVFDAYAQFEESMISARMEETAGDEGDGEDVDIDLRLARLERLMDRRPELLSSVLLRQNPHNCHEWQKRVKLFPDDPNWVVRTFTEAVKTVDPQRAKGKVMFLWINFAKYYEENGDADNARVIMEKAVQVEYTKVDDLAAVWCEYAELELRQENFDGALALMVRATKVYRKIGGLSKDIKDVYKDEPVVHQLYKSQKLWSFYVDLEESLGTTASTKAVYERIIELKIATPQTISNFAHFLEENNFFEEAFKAYEKGVNVFHFPNSLDLWNTYLTKFVARFGGKKLERARDLFDQCLEKCPAGDSKAFFLMYAKLEEDFGLARHAMNIYDRATKAVQESDRYEMYTLYIRKASEFYGVAKTRLIYEQAIGSLTEKDAKKICIQYAELERKLGEIDRARAIYIHCSQFCDPNVDKHFWNTWNEFEIAHGNQETFREMLRIKRSVQANFSTINFVAQDMMASANPGTHEPYHGKRKLDDIEELERQAQAAAAMPKEPTIAFESANPSDSEMKDALRTTDNPDEIELADDDEDGAAEEEVPEVKIQKKAIPAAVFGELAKQADDLEDDEKVGALERFKKKRKV